MSNDWSKAESHAQRAHRFFEAGQWEKALAELKQALAVNPLQADWLFGMGLTLEAMHRCIEAARYFQKVIDLRGEDYETLLHLGVSLLQGNRPKRAIKVLDRATKLNTRAETPYCYRILAYTKLGDHDHAEQNFYMARQFSEECPVCLDHMAHSLAARGELPKATWCWQQTLKLDPRYPGVNGNLARIHWRLEQHERAHSHFLDQMRDDPGDLDTLLDMGRLLIDMGRPSEAGEKFRRVLELDPFQMNAHLHLGELSLRQGHLDAAEVELSMSSRLDPDQAAPYIGLAQVAMRRGQPAAARAHLQAAMDRGPLSPRERLDLARLLIEVQWARAVPVVLAPIFDPEFRPDVSDAALADAFVYRGVSRMLLAELSEAVHDFRKALRLSKNHVTAMYNLAVACLTQQRLTHADYWLNKARQLSPDDAQLRQLRWRLRAARISQLATVAGKALLRQLYRRARR